MRSECPALLPDAIELEPDEAVRAHMVWLHGLGADGHDLAPVAEILGVSGIHHVLPHAPARPVTLNAGAAMRAWYDIATADLQWREDAVGMQSSAYAVRSLIETLQHERKLPVILAGFSQGAVISLATAALGVELKGVAVLSGYLPGYLTNLPANLSRIPVFMAHGRQDTVIPFALAKLGAQTLGKSGVTLDWHEYDMPHAISLHEINDLRAAVARWLDTGPVGA
jgi:phospholipase/carboxylesterase